MKDKYGIEFKDSRKYSMDGELLSDCVAWLDSLIFVRKLESLLKEVK